MPTGGRTSGSGGFLALLAAGVVLAVGGTPPLDAGASTAVPAARRLPPDFGNPAGHAPVPPTAQAVDVRHPDWVVGTGTPAGCTSAAVVRAVAKGGVMTMRCGVVGRFLRPDGVSVAQEPQHQPPKPTRLPGALRSFGLCFVFTGDVVVPRAVAAPVVGRPPRHLVNDRRGRSAGRLEPPPVSGPSRAPHPGRWLSFPPVRGRTSTASQAWFVHGQLAPVMAAPPPSRCSKGGSQCRQGDGDPEAPPRSVPRALHRGKLAARAHDPACSQHA